MRGLLFYILFFGFPLWMFVLSIIIVVIIEKIFPDKDPFW